MSGWFKGTIKVIGGVWQGTSNFLWVFLALLCRSSILSVVRVDRGMFKRYLNSIFSIPIACRRSLLVISHVVLVVADNVPLETVVAPSSPRSPSSLLSESALSSCPSLVSSKPSQGSPSAGA